MVTARVSFFFDVCVSCSQSSSSFSSRVHTRVCVCACDERSSLRIWPGFQTGMQGKKTPGTVREIKPQSEALRWSGGQSS